MFAYLVEFVMEDEDEETVVGGGRMRRMRRRKVRFRRTMLM